MQGSTSLLARAAAARPLGLPLSAAAALLGAQRWAGSAAGAAAGARGSGQAASGSSQAASGSGSAGRSAAPGAAAAASDEELGDLHPGE